MISKNLSYKLISFLIFCSVFLFEFKIIGVPLSYLIFLLLLIVLLFHYKRLRYEGFFLKSIIKRIIFILSIYSFIILVLNYSYVDVLIENNKFNTGLVIDFLYFKMVLASLILLFLSYFSFSLGYSLGNDLKTINRVVSLIINLCFFISLVNVFTWYLNTGGVFGRYNFDPILISSYGVNTQWSNLGFLLLLSENKKFKIFSFRTIKLFTLYLGVFMILSRSSAIIFIVSFFLYFYFTSKGSRNFLFLFISPLILLFIFTQNFEIINLISEVNSFENESVSVRVATILNSIEIFKEHILTGVGFGMWALYNTATVLVERQSVNLGSSHNGFFSILAEGGLIGLIIHFTLIFNILKSVLKNLKTNITYCRYNFVLPIAIFIMLNLILFLTQNYSLYPPSSELSYYGISVVSWILLGIVISFNNKKVKIS